MNIGTSFRIAYSNGVDLAYYRDKKEFLEDIKGIEDGIFHLESLEVNRKLSFRGEKYKIIDIQVEFQGILDGVDSRVNINDQKSLSKIFIVVVIYVE